VTIFAKALTIFAKALTIARERQALTFFSSAYTYYIIDGMEKGTPRPSRVRKATCPPLLSSIWSDLLLRASVGSFYYRDSFHACHADKEQQLACININ